MFVFSYEYIKGGYLDKHVETIRKMYKKNRDIMVEELIKQFPKEVKWKVPKGGMFIWIELPKTIDTRIMFQKAISKKVAYVVGEAFFPEGGNYHSMRLNFSFSDEKKIREGIHRLAEVIKEEIKTDYQNDLGPNGV